MVKPSANLDNLTEQTLLLEDLGLDSLTMMLMSLGVENKFGIRFTGKESLRTLGDVMCSINEKLGN